METKNECGSGSVYIKISAKWFRAGHAFHFIITLNINASSVANVLNFQLKLRYKSNGSRNGNRFKKVCETSVVTVAEA